jgi:exonuclease SbcC
MKIEKVRLNPFAHITDRELTFTDGLNVILGPNEAGKTTVFNAIQHVLFTPADLTSSKFDSILKKYLPVGGGDTIKVVIELRSGSRKYVLQRTWGAKSSAELRLPGGSQVRDDAAIGETLEPLLGAKEGTYRSVLMTYQTGLAHTLEDLKTKYIETVHTLGDILRRSFLETDGVSVDLFKENLKRLYDEYCSHWDFKQVKPEKGKRYKTKVGLILKAFYYREDIKSSLTKALSYEEKLDRINQEITFVSGEIVKKEQYIEQNQEIVDAARKRQGLEKDMMLVEKDIEALKEANSRWPVLESKTREMEKSLTNLENRMQTLKKEKFEAETQEKNKKLIDKYEHALNRKDKLSRAEEVLAGVKRLTGEDLGLIQEAVFNLKTLETRLSSGKLSLTLNAKKDLSLLIRKDSEQAVERKVRKNNSIKVDAGSRIAMGYPDFSMEIQSGEGNIDDLIKCIDNARKKADNLLAKFEIDSYEKALEINKIYEQALKETETLRKILFDELGEESFEGLESKVKALKPEKKTAPLTDIVADLADVQNSIDNIKNKRIETNQTIEKFESEYRSHDQLLEMLSESIKKKNIIADELKTLPPLPEDVDDTERFISQYETVKKKKDELNRKEKEILLERAQLERDAPELSSEEYQKQLADAEETFGSVLQKGISISRVIDVTDRIIRSIDSSTYRGIEEKIQDYISLITDGKYEKIRMAKSLPEGFVREDGETLSYELLSTGTRDVLALALRLSMAEYFLGNSNGFLLMDDPLVNLDPDRQTRATEVIREFCKTHQLLLFSCHPRHAGLLGGNLIEL